MRLIIDNQTFIPILVDETRNFPKNFQGNETTISASAIWIKEDYTLRDIWQNNYLCLNQVARQLTEQYPLASKNAQVTKWL